MSTNDDDEITRVPPQRNRGGAWITFGLQQYRVPALALGAIRDLQPEIDSLRGIKGLPSKDQIEAVATIFHSALSRNYPEISREEIIDMVDMSNFNALLAAVMQVSGFERAAPGEARTQST